MILFSEEAKIVPHYGVVFKRMSHQSISTAELHKSHCCPEVGPVEIKIPIVTRPCAAYSASGTVVVEGVIRGKPEHYPAFSPGTDNVCVVVYPWIQFKIAFENDLQDTLRGH